MFLKEKVMPKLTTLTSTRYPHSYRVSILVPPLIVFPKSGSFITRLAKMSIDPRFLSNSQLTRWLLIEDIFEISVCGTTAACAAGVVTKTTDDRDSLRYNTYNGTRRVCQLALRCESNWVKSTHDAYENTWKCGELKLYFSPSAGGWKKIKKNNDIVW